MKPTGLFVFSGQLLATLTLFSLSADLSSTLIPSDGAGEGDQVQMEQDKPSFFTIIKEGEGHNTNHMKVPPKIFRYVGEELWKNAINLIGPSGDKWQVTTFKKGNDMYLKDGWPKFLTDNSVRHQEFLLFTYNNNNGENHFQVQIFSENGCERLCFKKPKQEEEEEAAATPSLAKKKGVNQEKNKLNHNSYI